MNAQGLCQTPTDVLILAAQLAFLRSEIAVKRTNPAAFLIVETASVLVTSRGARLRDLRDRISDACEEALRSHPAWPSLSWVEHLALVMIAEAVIGAGAPVRYRAARDHCRRALESFVPGDGVPTETEVSAVVSRLIEAGLVHPPYQFDRGLGAFVPVCIPLEALADAA